MNPQEKFDFLRRKRIHFKYQGKGIWEAEYDGFVIACELGDWPDESMWSIWIDRQLVKEASSLPWLWTRDEMP